MTVGAPLLATMLHILSDNPQVKCHVPPASHMKPSLTRLIVSITKIVLFCQVNIKGGGGEGWRGAFQNIGPNIRNRALCGKSMKFGTHLYEVITFNFSYSAISDSTFSGRGTRYSLLASYTIH